MKTEQEVRVALANAQARLASIETGTHEDQYGFDGLSLSEKASVLAQENATISAFGWCLEGPRQPSFLEGADIAVRRLGWLQQQLNGIRDNQDLEWSKNLYARFARVFGTLAAHLYHNKLRMECGDNAYEWFAQLDEGNKLLFLTHQAFA